MSSKEIKDERLSKQLGDFGESLVMFILGNMKGCKVALVDHEGADIIATDRKIEGKRYAISVKSRWFKTDGYQKGFDESEQEKLRRFANEFDMIPTIAFVMIDKEAKYVDIYLVTLDNLDNMANNTNGITSTGLVNTTLRFSNALRNQKVIQNHDKIDHTRLEISKLNNTLNI